MAYFTCKAGVPVNQFAVDHDTTSKTGAQGEDDEILHALGSAKHHFAHCCRVRVVGDCHFHIEFLFYKVAKRNDSFP